VAFLITAKKEIKPALLKLNINPRDGVEYTIYGPLTIP